MRLKEDRSSWRSSAIVHKDNRHDHSEGTPSLKSHKNRRKWCRGKRGVEHEIIRYIEKGFEEWGWISPNRMYGKCVNCGRVFYGKSWKRKTSLSLIIQVDHEYEYQEVVVRRG